MIRKRTILLFLVCTGMCFGQWVQVDSGLPSNVYVGSFAVSGSNIFAGGGGVFISANNGTSWTAVDSGLHASVIVNSLAVSGSNIFAGTHSGIFLSTNNGTSWNAVNSGLTDTGVQCLAVSGSNLFAGTANSGGVFLSTNNGASWTAVNAGLQNITVSCLVVSGTNIFAGSWSGVFHSANNGTSWAAVDSGPALVNCFAVSGGNLFAGTNYYKFQNGGIFLSNNNGTNWIAIDSGLPPNPRTTYVTCFAVSSGNIFAGVSGSVFLSTNNGISWTAVDSGLPANSIVRSLAVSGDNIFAGTAGSGVWRRPLSEMLAVINPIPHQVMLRTHAGFIINVRKNGIALLLPETLNNGAIVVELVNIAGRKIYSATHQACNGSLDIPISGLSTGTYLMSISGRNITRSLSFVVTK